MTTQQHLLICCAEECAEVQQAIAKALRFGLDDVHPEYGESNAVRIAKELDDLEGVIEMLRSEVGIPRRNIVRVMSKKHRVERWMRHAREQGTLQDPQPVEAGHCP